MIPQRNEYSIFRLFHVFFSYVGSAKTFFMYLDIIIDRHSSTKKGVNKLSHFLESSGLTGRLQASGDFDRILVLKNVLAS